MQVRRFWISKQCCRSIDGLARWIWRLEVWLDPDHLRRWKLRPVQRRRVHRRRNVFARAMRVNIKDHLIHFKMASFCVFSFFSNNLPNKTVEFQRDLNLDCRSRRRARWPLDHQHHAFDAFLFPKVDMEIIFCKIF